MATIGDRMAHALAMAKDEIDELEREVDELHGMLKACRAQRKLLVELLSARQREDFDKKLKALRFEEKADNS